MPLTSRLSRRRLLLLTVVGAALAVAATAAAVTLFLGRTASGPEHRAVFLVDASAVPSADAGNVYEFTDITDAVAATALNAADDDALSLRRFGGACDTPDNTAQLVPDAAQNGRPVANAVRNLKPSGQATLHSGILAAVDDLAESNAAHNRIIVITAHGADACTDPESLDRDITRRLDETDLDLDFRYVGYRLTDEDRRTLARTAAATDAPDPVQTDTTEDLATTLREFTVPSSYEAAPAEVPRQSTSVTACKTGEHHMGREIGPVPASLPLPEGFSLPSGTALYGYGDGGFLVGPAQARCTMLTIGAAAGTSVEVSAANGSRTMTYFLGSAHNHVTAACNDFGGIAPELEEELRGSPWQGCKADGDTQNIPTGSPGLYIGVSQWEPERRDFETPLPEGSLSFSLDVSDLRKGISSHSSSCTAHKDRLDLCTAAFTYHFIQLAEERGTSAEDIDRVSGKIASIISDAA
ncbi:hypothetical protein QCN29_00190 [Streptomyces sp. HNM0663]|uniref:VWFA domain-containing protein n=1 Tax=Streptomyces chengmaiensis TaxID=3040919 RepID=A0ABT6HG72_9ACTN|nr:hypothetical protein [Streptomyces chengmaiensis]MDH2387228.1 hypothetical protein [Streptomyces chengmaiensis]